MVVAGGQRLKVWTLRGDSFTDQRSVDRAGYLRAITEVWLGRKQLIAYSHSYAPSAIEVLDPATGQMNKATSTSSYQTNMNIVSLVSVGGHTGELVSASANKTIQLWSLQQETVSPHSEEVVYRAILMRTVVAHHKTIYGMLKLSCSSSTLRLVTVSYDGSIKGWNINGACEFCCQDVPIGDMIIEVNSRGMIGVMYKEGTLRLWKPIRRFSPFHSVDCMHHLANSQRVPIETIAWSVDVAMLSVRYTAKMNCKRCCQLILDN